MAFKPKVIYQKEYYEDGYYHLRQDIELYPGAVIIIVWSFRGPGKTYSFLRMMVEDKIKFVYLKRTADDVDLICAKSSGVAIDHDPSPFVPLNRDFGWNIHPISKRKGIGDFYHCNEDDEPIGESIGSIYALSRVKSVKGMDLSDIDYICLDEFIPQQHERYLRSEFSALLDFVLTCSRDRIARGKKPIKLILFANSENIACPITSGLEVIDHMAEMNANGESRRYLEDRRILLHHILPEEAPKVSEGHKLDGFYQAMKGTKWAKKAYEGLFTNNDFSNVCRMNLKNFVPYIQIKYNDKKHFIYRRDSDSMLYMCMSPKKCPLSYDLDKENDQKLFWIDQAQELKYECVEGRMKFSRYSQYDLIINYKNYFKV